MIDDVRQAIDDVQLGAVVVVPWTGENQIVSFMRAWGIDSPPSWLILHHDVDREGCGVSKNKAIAEAVRRGAEMVVVLDDDCFPTDEVSSLEELVYQHSRALRPAPVGLYEEVTSPPSRGTPYHQLTATMPVAASMGFWSEVGDYCAVRQLAHDGAPMEFRRKTVFGRYFPLCGMNLAFRPKEWLPWCQFIDVPRFDDIWMGWLWQREAYRRGFCFNLAGPIVRHSRQSNVWKNLQLEAVHLERTETLWREIATHQAGDYESLCRLLPTTK